MINVCTAIAQISMELNQTRSQSSLITHFIAEELCFFMRAKKKMSEYDQKIPQSHTADQPMAPRVRATEQ